MNKVLLYISLIWLVLIGNLIKLKVWFMLMCLNRVSLSKVVEPNLIVSLTSYGKRVTNNSVCYTLYSLLAQHRRPQEIILWLDEDEFNDNTLPAMLRRLKNHGVQVRYCENIRSFKKIIPSMRTFPDADIITVDDDIYYSPSMVDELVMHHKLQPKNVIALGVRMPQLENGKFQPYKQWQKIHHISQTLVYNPMLPMPVGQYGIFYPAHIFDDEALNMETAMLLCPLADDLWLYIMGLRCHVNKTIVPASKVTYYFIDLLRQHFSRDRLYATNVCEDMNDVQLHKLLEHYAINPAEL